jgi:Glutaredoxin-like domain (DUF836)
VTNSPALPTIDFYTRTGCQICDEARATLQTVLEERAKRGDPIAHVRYVNLADRPDLEADYGAWLPVLEVRGQKLTLSSTYRPIAQFLDVTLGRLA